MPSFLRAAVVLALSIVLSFGLSTLPARADGSAQVLGPATKKSSPGRAGSLAVGKASYAVPKKAIFVSTKGSDKNPGTRAKPVMQDFKTKQNARPTKTRRNDVPWDPAADGDLMFEMTTMVILDPSAPGCPVHQIKVADQFKALLDPRRPMGVDTGRAMAEWARGQGDAQRQKEILDAAREQARRGTAAFTEWFKSNPEYRPVVRTIIDSLKATCAEADTAANQADDDPFPTPSPESIAAAEAAALAEIEARNRDSEAE